ncbi:MAG: hypothetical protein HOO96_35750 [Polyangiaceae bacterium]|nr:hypothetical protein [Polyangiaceae bacterium]
MGDPRDGDELFRSLARAACDAHPTLASLEPGFVDHVRTLGVSQDVSAERAADLLLAFACSIGNGSALGLFERLLETEVARAHARVRPAIATDEARQLVRERLLVAGPDAPARIATYRGEGALGPFVRIVATRLLLNLKTRAPDEVALEASFIETSAAGGGTSRGNPEFLAFRNQYAEGFREAFRETVHSLDARERALLKYAMCDDLRVEDIGLIYGVHKATAARWVSQARARLEKRFRAAVKDRCNLSEAEVASVARAVQSQLDLSLSRLFGDAGDAPDDRERS